MYVHRPASFAEPGGGAIIRASCAPIPVTYPRRHETVPAEAARDAGGRRAGDENGWHLALFLIEQDLLDEALALYVTQVWGVSPDDSQDQVSAVSLRARLELAGAHVGPRGQPLADRLAAWVDDHVEPFLDMHCLYGLARVGRPGADRMMASVEAFAAAAPPASH